ncbi:MAG TPA: methylated-DNA--[protein]-cysteine S-methyltransferase [bacterium]|nr:methylated-DNA--[protein]-cysteine S-methyltransferase [bacterium]
MELFVDRMSSPIGSLLLVWQPDALCALSFYDREERLRRRLRVHDGLLRLKTERAPDAIRVPIEAYFRGEITAIDRVPVHADGTPFQRRVWAALREIPAGSTTTYGALATRIGRCGASRAVGLANGSNPVAIVVPCHRVIGADGTLTGYGGGIDRKRWLLEHERGGVLGI